MLLRNCLGRGLGVVGVAATVLNGKILIPAGIAVVAVGGAIRYTWKVKGFVDRVKTRLGNLEDTTGVLKQRLRHLNQNATNLKEEVAELKLALQKLQEEMKEYEMRDERCIQHNSLGAKGIKPRRG